MRKLGILSDLYSDLQTRDIHISCERVSFNQATYSTAENMYCHHKSYYVIVHRTFHVFVTQHLHIELRTIGLKFPKYSVGHHGNLLIAAIGNCLDCQNPT